MQKLNYNVKLNSAYNESKNLVQFDGLRLFVKGVKKKDPDLLYFPYFPVQRTISFSTVVL